MTMGGTDAATAGLILAPEGEPVIRVTRGFAAPPALVMHAHLDPALFRRWMGSRKMPLLICNSDARPGDTFRHVRAPRRPGQTDIALTGRFWPPARRGSSRSRCSTPTGRTQRRMW